LVLTRADIARCLSVAEAIPLVEQAYRAVSSGTGDYPLRTHVRLSGDAGDALFMPAYDGARFLGLKSVTVHPANLARHGLPGVRGLYLFLDATRGDPLALMEAGSLTALRTGAAGGLAARVLARPDARVVALFGAGGQARAQLEAVCAVRDVAEVRLYSRDPQHAAAFVAEMAERVAAPVRRVAAPADAVRGADIVIAATSSPRPVFAGSDLAAGTHVTGVGSYTAAMQEVDAETVARARVFVDSLAAALAEAGDLLAPLRAGIIDEGHIRAELGQVLLGQRPGRTSPDEITFFKSVGLAAQDIYTADAIYRRACERGLGVDVEV
jgi:alanine dehydrogenase